MLADALSSVAIIVGYIVIYYTDWYFIDIILALLVAVVIGKWAYSILKDSINTLLESSPVDIEELKKFITNLDVAIIDVHDIHVWEITQDMFNITAHIKIDNKYIDKHKELIDKINHKIEHNYNIAHSTFQLEW